MWVSRRVYGAGCSMGRVDLSVGEQEGLWGGLFYGAGCSMGWVDLSVDEQEGLWGGWFYGEGGFKCG